MLGCLYICLCVCIHIHPCVQTLCCLVSFHSQLYPSFCSWNLECFSARDGMYNQRVFSNVRGQLWGQSLWLGDPTGIYWAWARNAKHPAVLYLHNKALSHQKCQYCSSNIKKYLKWTFPVLLKKKYVIQVELINFCWFCCQNPDASSG